MMNGIVIYALIAAEQIVFEQELERRRHKQDAMRAIYGSPDRANGVIKRFAGTIRKLAGSGYIDSVKVAGEGATGL